MRIVIFAGIRETEIEYMKDYLLPNDYIIGCDAGIDTISRLGLKPDIMIGDFDSVNFRIFEKYEDVHTITFDKEKDYSDLDLALQYCSELSPVEVVCFGVLGGRVDHCLSNIRLLKEYSLLGTDIKFYDKGNELFFTERSIAIKKTKQYFSLVPYSEECVVSLDGVMYEIDKLDISKYQTLTISNEITNNFAKLKVHSGCVLIIQSDSTID